jgi:hypothetical protein
LTDRGKKGLGREDVSRQYRFRVRLFALSLALALALPLESAPAAAAARARAAPRRLAGRMMPLSRPRIAVQPIDGPGGAALRAQVAQILRGRGFRVVTSLAPVTGTAQYPGLAKDNDITAFVVGGIDGHPRRQSVTFLVWTGSDGSVVDRWSVGAPATKELCGAVSRGFWPRLGRSLTRMRRRVPPRLTPARPMRIDAADDQDEPIASDGNGFFHRRLPVRD